MTQWWDGLIKEKKMALIPVLDELREIADQIDRVTQTSQEPEDGWETWTDNLCRNIETAPNVESVNTMLAKNAERLAALNDASTSLYNSVNAAAKARIAAISKSKE